MDSFAVVTGGNRGLGLEVCRKLVKLNKPTILTARGAAGAQPLQQEKYRLTRHFPSHVEAQF